ncbi:MAG: protein-arginine omega-N symmetric methyltransferase activity, variant 2 [Marteilia pararefringens]
MIDCIAAASSPAAPPEAAPLWHIAMLNDSSRNSLYRRSIAHAFEKLGCRSIMDIGCGSGLLAAYALQVLLPPCFLKPATLKCMAVK